MEKLNGGLVFTDDSCIACNKCVAMCPVMGANVFSTKNGKTTIGVDSSKCIECGYCVTKCYHNARGYLDNTKEFFMDLEKLKDISVVVSQSFFINYGEDAYKVLAILKKLGVKKIYDEVYGTDIFVWGCMNYIREINDKVIMPPNCPTVVDYIEKQVPQLIPYMIPIQNPLMCTVSYARKYENDKNDFAYISPCISKNIGGRIEESKVKYIVTIKNIMEYLAPYIKNDLKLTSVRYCDVINEFSRLKKVGIGKICSFTGGLKEYFEYFVNKDRLIWKLGDINKIYKQLGNISDFSAAICKKVYAIEAISCDGGCVFGPGTDKTNFNKEKFFSAALSIRNISSLLADEQFEKSNSLEERYKVFDKIFSMLDLKDFQRTFEDKYEVQIPIPKETIEEIFQQMHMVTEQQKNTNCQSCGYETCRDFAKAVASGYCSIENCISYSRNENTRILMTDKRTGISNENAYIFFLQNLISKEIASEYLVMNLNIKNFTLINERFGSSVGDYVIWEFSNKLASIVGKDEIVAHVGGNTFFAIMKKKNADERLEKINSISIELTEGDEVIDYSIPIRAGIYMINENDTSVSEISNRVSIAFTHAKKHETKDFVYFDNTIKRELLNEMTIRRLLPKALKNKEFIVYYQPKVEVETKKLIGAEALVRWQSNGKIVPPMDFIPICERNGFVKQIDLYVLEYVCQNIREWLDNGVEVVRISSNFSKHHFEERDIADKINDIVNKYNIPHKYIEVEFTETAYVDKQDNLSYSISRLKELGFTSSMDDFGSGYSSINLLQELNFDVLKLDKSLLGKGVNDYKTQKIIASIVRMAKDLNLEIIAEGVETVDEYNLLCELRCDMIQGYFFDRPLSKTDFLNRLKNKKYS